MDGVLVPLTRTPSAKRTRDGLSFNLAFFAAVNRDDFLAVCCCWSDGRGDPIRGSLGGGGKRCEG